VTYATLANIEARYPGELAQAGPLVDGELDEDAVTLALQSADAVIDQSLWQAGWTVPVGGSAPYWVRDLAVDLALYLATPTVLASQSAFADRRQRYLAARATLQQIAQGTLSSVGALDLSVAFPTSLAGANPRLFSPGIL
jgi:phage gp36-like protein